MAASNMPKFFMRLQLTPKHELALVGLLFAARKMALEVNPNTVEINIRADAHATTTDTEKGGYKRDGLHLTIDIKDATMVAAKTHLTIHGYVASDATTEQSPNWWNINNVIPKKKAGGALKIENDEYLDPRRNNRKINNWSSSVVHQIQVPASFANVKLGTNFITVESDILKNLSALEQEKEKQAAFAETTNLRRQAKQEIDAEAAQATQAPSVSHPPPNQGPSTQPSKGTPPKPAPTTTTTTPHTPSQQTPSKPPASTTTHTPTSKPAPPTSHAPVTPKPAPTAAPKTTPSATHPTTKPGPKH